jgi:hypothetical protein
MAVLEQATTANPTHALRRPTWIFPQPIGILLLLIMLFMTLLLLDLTPEWNLP